MSVSEMSMYIIYISLAYNIITLHMVCMISSKITIKYASESERESEIERANRQKQ